MAGVIYIRRLVMLVFEIQRLEVEPFVSDAVVYPDGIQNAEGVGREHDSAALDEAVGADFQYSLCNAEFVVHGQD